MANEKSKKGRATEDDIIIGQNLRKIRLLKGLSQQDLADRLGITFQQVQKYEKGSNRVSATRLLAIACALQVDIQDLYGELLDDTIAEPETPMSSQVLDMCRILAKIENKDTFNQIKRFIRILAE